MHGEAQPGLGISAELRSTVLDRPQAKDAIMLEPPNVYSAVSNRFVSTIQLELCATREDPGNVGPV